MPGPQAITGKIAKTSETPTDVAMKEDFGPGSPFHVVQEGNNWILSGTVEAKDQGLEGEIVLFIDDKGNYTKLNKSDARLAYLAEAKKGKGVEYLRKRLYDAGLMSEAQYKVKDEEALANAIISSARTISINAVTNYQDSGVLITKSFDSYLTPMVTANNIAKTPKPASGLNLTTRTDTDQDINEYFFTMLGRRATLAERQDYYNQVAKEEKAALVKQTATQGGKVTTTGEYLDAEDYARIKARVITPAIKGTDLEALNKGNGKVSQSVVELKEYAASYGIRLDTKQALDKVVSVFSPSGVADLDIAKNGIKSMAKGFYGNISGLIEEGVKPSDIANQYAAYKSKLLDMPDDSISIFDEDIQAALANKDATGAQKAGVMSIAEYQKLLRTSPKTKPKWLDSPGAKEEASGYANDILRMFGLRA